MVDTLAEQVLDARLVQPDQTTCGSCVLVMSQVLNNPSYAEFLVNGEDPETGRRQPGTLEDRFRHEALAMHRLTSGARTSRGAMQIPWPRALGTQPWSLARQLDGGSGEKGRTYDVVPILPSRRAQVFQRVAGLARAGHAVPLYVGNRWSPRHVVLILPGGAADGSAGPSGAVEIYDPASGRRARVSAEDFAAGELAVAGWTVPWVVVVPH